MQKLIYSHIHAGFFITALLFGFSFPEIKPFGDL